MTDTQGFYKNDNGTLLYGPNFVLNANYELRIESKDDYTYPVDGWSYFPSRQDALTAYGIVEDDEVVGLGDANL